MRCLIKRLPDSSPLLSRHTFEWDKLSHSAEQQAALTARCHFLASHGGLPLYEAWLHGMLRAAFSDSLSRLFGFSRFWYRYWYNAAARGFTCCWFLWFADTALLFIFITIIDDIIWVLFILLVTEFISRRWFDAQYYSIMPFMACIAKLYHSEPLCWYASCCRPY